MSADDLVPIGARASADTMLTDTYGTSTTRLRWEASNQWPCMPPSRKVTLCLAPSTCSLHSDSVNFLKQPSSSSGLLRYFMCYCLVAPPAGISTQVKVTLDCGNLGEGNASTVLFFQSGDNWESILNHQRINSCRPMLNVSDGLCFYMPFLQVII